jgi:hypothetical protein
MKLKRYDDFLNEDLTPMAGDVEDFTEEGPEVGEMEDEVIPEPQPEMEDEVISEPQPEMEEEMPEEEEEYQFQGAQLLDELANRLGAKVENNQINYNGKKIEYFSETEAFAIDRKGKYKTVDEVVSQLEK